ncbi:MAG: sigma-70 family RNA polymerase sigma factor [Planctomycetaceae bacterium]|nr:sigma-70 family RNA polymerase sigma factor [Planctomycetaceae bacterium]
MPRYRNPALRQLAEQQVKYAPRDVRLTQIARTEQLIPTLESEETYYYRDLCEEITSYRTDLYPDMIVTGDEALHDLRCFVEDLSASVRLPVELAGERVLSLEEVQTRFNVSEKTVQRWRDRGLVSRWFVVDGRIRLGFLESAVARFAEARPQDVRRGAAFRQLAEEEYERIVRRARRLVRAGATMSAISERLARRFRRSPETIRYTIRRHDTRFPDAAVFPAWRGPMSEEARRDLYRNARRGVSADALARQHHCTKSTVYRVISEERARRLKDQTIDFVDSDEFHRPEAESTLLADPPVPSEVEGETKPPPGLPAYLASLYNIPVLGREEEAWHFRKFNFLKFLAVQAQAQIDPRRPRASLLDRMDECLRQSHETKNFLIRSNLRLVVSIARRHLKPGGNFFEMVSDGNMALIQAIERFDYRKGNKFSTYGTWAVMKSFARSQPAELTLQDRFRTGRDDVLERSRDLRAVDGQRESANRRQHEALVSALDHLDPRERAIIMYRFGLGTEGEAETREQVGRRLGVTKERIRQLEQRALEKLKQLALDEDLELPDSAD